MSRKASTVRQLESYEHLIGGLSGGVTSTMACHPLDLLRIRFSADEGNETRPRYRNYWHAAKSIVGARGFRGMYQGLSSNLIGSSLSWGLYFQYYHVIRDKCERHAITTGMHEVDRFLYGMVTGTCILSITNPVWVTKTRLCLQYENEGAQYRGMLDCMRELVRNEGVRSLYKGFLPGTIGTAHGALQFMLYNLFKERRFRSLGLPPDPDEILGTFDCLIFSAVSKIIATTVTFPYQVLRTRLQDQHANYKGLRDAVKKTYRFEGLRGFYKGLLMGNLRQLPNVVVTFVTYENVRHLIRRLDRSA